jgi:hypothetical protein
MRLNRYEQVLESWASATGGLSSIMAAASRSARQAVAAPSPREEALRDVAASVAAPLLAGFVLWVLQRAQDADLKRLYFVSRDGQMLLEIARRLSHRLESSCELRYLYASRQAWWVPAASAAVSEQLEPFVTDTGRVSLRTILARLSVEPEEIADGLKELGFQESDWSRDLPPQERQKVRAMIRNGILREIVERATARKRELLLRYLKQEDLLERADWALVDLGWRGTLQKALGVVLAKSGAGPPRGFYVGVITDPFLGIGAPWLEASCGAMDAYLFDERSRRGMATIGPTAAHMIELFCTGTEGAVIGYQEHGERVTPVLATPLNEPALAAGLPLVRQTICHFSEELARGSGVVSPDVDVRPATTAILSAFWRTPPRAAAAAWATFPFELNLARAESTQLATRFSWSDVVDAFRTGVLGRRDWRPWVAGSLVITPATVRFALRAGTPAGRALRRVLRPLTQAIGRVRAPRYTSID